VAQVKATGNFGHQEPAVYAGILPAGADHPPPEGFVDEDGQSVPLGSLHDLEQELGLRRGPDQDFQNLRSKVIRALVECVSKNGNMLLNVGPGCPRE